MLPPPARSKQMNGILPAPVEMLHGPNRALMSPANPARAERGAASIARSEGPITVAEPVMKLWARNSRRVRGRECSWRRSGSCNPRAFDFLLIYKDLFDSSCLIDHHLGAAERRCACSRGHRVRPRARGAIVVGAQIADQSAQFG